MCGVNDADHLFTMAQKYKKMLKHKDLSEFDKGPNCDADDWVRGSPELQLLWDFTGLQCSVSIQWFQGRNSCEPVTG